MRGRRPSPRGRRPQASGPRPPRAPGSPQPVGRIGSVSRATAPASHLFGPSPAGPLPEERRSLPSPRRTSRPCPPPLLIPASPASSPNSTPASKPPWSPLGDSNTEQTFHTRGALNFFGLLQCALLDKYGANQVIAINAACCGEGAAGGLARLDRDVLRFDPDLVIICYWDEEMTALRQIVQRLQATGHTEVLLRTPQPIVVPNMPAIPCADPPLVANSEWPANGKEQVAARIVALGEELGVPVVDHYTAWLTADTAHPGPPVSNPNRLWMLMSDATHPGPLGHLFFYRQLALFFGLPEKLPWEL